MVAINKTMDYYTFARIYTLLTHNKKCYFNN